MFNVYILILLFYLFYLEYLNRFYFFFFLICRIIAGNNLNTENKDQLLSSWAWICGFFIEIFLLCYTCTCTVNESKAIGCNLHRFSFKNQIKNIQCKIKV